MTREVKLLVNDQPVEIDYFVQGFIDHTTGGVLAGLEGVGRIESATVSIEGDEVTINLNNALLQINPFVSKIIKNTIVGMVSSLKRVSNVDKVKISIKR